MKPMPRREEPAQKSRHRRHRARPTPRWLKQAEGLDAVARRRCLLVLSVLSGEVPVTDAIGAAGISRPLYYQLEERALSAMLRALGPAPEDSSEAQAHSLAREVEALKDRVKQLETEKRRAERLLLLTRKLVKPGPLTTGRGRPRKTDPSSTKSGRRPSPESTRPTMSPEDGASSQTMAGAAEP